MIEGMNQEFLDLVTGRPGHFRLESGHHSRLWLDLDGLFAEPARVRPLVDRLAEALRAHDVAMVCGPLVGGAFLAQALSPVLEVEFAFTERALPAGREGLYRAEYRLPPGLHARVRDKRVAIVDDVVSAGSAVRGTYAELRAHGAQPAVIGAIAALGSQAPSFFAQQGLHMASVFQVPYELWMPAECPLCASGAALEDVATADRT
jgi:orotate phosphoribosyltransferase